MFVLLFVATIPFSYLGDYKDSGTCQAAIREIYAQRINPPGQRLKELTETINLAVANQKEFLCVRKG